MAQRIPDYLMPQLTEFMARHLGLNFPRERWPDLVRGLREACTDLKFSDECNCAEALLKSDLSQERAEILASYLTIGETYFFRESQVLGAMEKDLIPELLRQRAGRSPILRLWSAGCSTGEEPYSLAMLLHRSFPILREQKATILATDINPRALHKAAAGVYTDWSFRGTPDSIKDTYFRKQSNGRHAINGEIREMVTFAYLNLSQDTYPALMNNTTAMDVIFCRNVLMYFTPSVAAGVVARFERALLPGGWLVVSPCDASHADRGKFRAATINGATVFIKEQQPTAAPLVPRRRSTQNMSPQLGSTHLVRSPDMPRRPRQPEEPKVRPEASPQHDHDIRQQAITAFASGDYLRAIHLGRTLLKRSPHDSQVIDIISRSHANLGELAQALKWCDDALRANPLDTPLRLLRATVLQEEGRTDEAMAELKRVLYLNPREPVAHFSLGNLAHGRNDFVQASHHLRQTLLILDDLEPDKVLPHSDGITVGRMRQIIEATLRSEVPA